MANPACKLFGDWNKIPEVLTLAARFSKAVEQSILKEAQLLRTGIVKGIQSGSPAGKVFAPLSPLTLALRKAKGFGGSKPLNVTGTLRGNITVKRVGQAAVFIGLLRQSAGARPVNLGEIHEFGATVRTTPKSRAWLFANLRKLGIKSQPTGRMSTAGASGPNARGTTFSYIHIPARPFVGPVVEQERPKIVQRFWENVAKGVGGDLGQPR